VLLPGIAAADSGSVERRAHSASTAWQVQGLIVLFILGLLQSVRTYVLARRTIRRQIDAPKPSLDQINTLAQARGRTLPLIVIMVPARDESAVIHNTLQRLGELDYPRDRFAVVVITDARERGSGDAPTTKAIAEQIAARWKAKSEAPFVHVVDVPEWYSGRFGDASRTHARSTKGRALNYALEYIGRDEQLSTADMLGVLDADGRMHRHALREVAHLVLARGERLVQGPVFQISNLPAVGLMGKAAGIELSIYHLSTLSRQLMSGRDTARFLAGTNYFVNPQLMIEVGGWDDTALVEDAELGLRLYLQKRVRPGWLSCHEVEQTPPDCAAYLRQRQRWALGHFQLLPIIARSNLPWFGKLRLRAKVLHSIFMCPFDVGLPIVSWVALIAGWAAEMPPMLRWVMFCLMIGSIFVWDYFGRGARMLNRYATVQMSHRQSWRLSLQFILAMPWLMALQSWPRMAALFKYATGRYSQEWQKTKRTVERPVPLSEASGVHLLASAASMERAHG
jgi:cellulose synthase/poly-beta-1,6-N-acetylglucosamine synthase-like glycosyltransferase